MRISELLERPSLDWLPLIDQHLAEKKLSDFVRQAWRYADPAIYSHNWHIDAISDHLEAVANRQIKRLVINVPPRRMKSLTVNVFFPAWVWAQDPDPDSTGHGRFIRPGAWMGAGVRFLSASYAIRLAIRDNVRCRRVIDSAWYQEGWGSRISFAQDQNTKSYYENQQGGARFATGVDAGVTGEGGDIILIDDPINTDDANSEAMRESVLTWWSEAMPTRLNDAKNGCFVIIMQRVHERDLTGYVLAKELGWDHLCLPEKFEAQHPYPTVSRIGFKDPRKDGDLLWPDRFDEKVYEDLSLSLGAYATAGQLQQRPSPREGGMFERRWFEVVDAAPADADRCRAWDLAATEKQQGTNPDYTVGVRMSRTRDGLIYVEDVIRFRGASHEVEKSIVAAASQDDAMTVKRTRVRLPQDPGAAGKAWAQYMVRQLQGRHVLVKPVTGSKTVRADPFASQAAARNVKLVKGAWNEAFLEELELFPFGSHDDQVDAASDAFSELVLGGSGKAVQATVKGHY